MTKDQAMDAASALFLQGYNCAQAVFGAFAQTVGLNPEMALRLSAPFGGGIGRTREVCGAVSGALMVLGMIESPEPCDKAQTYEHTRALLDRFKRENGSIICRELLAGVNVTAGGAPEERTEQYYKKRPCPELVAQAAGFAWELLHERGVL